MAGQRGAALSSGRLCGQVEKSSWGSSTWGLKADCSMSHAFSTKCLLPRRGTCCLLHLPALRAPGCRSCCSTTPVTHKWAQHRAAQQRPTGCDSCGYRAPESYLLSQASLNFPRQTLCIFRHLVTHLLPLVPSPCATWELWVCFLPELQHLRGMLACPVRGMWVRCSGDSPHHVPALGLQLPGMWLEVPFLPFQSCVPNSSETIPKG